MTAKRERIGPEPTSIELRYEVLRTLGQGAAGVVYKVRDRASSETLALKKLLRMDPKAVARLKNEFRALADLHHPNLIKLYDLGHTEDAWFITMEYLEGVDLVAHLLGPGRARDSASTMVTATIDIGPVPANQNQAPHNLERICDVFGQLARGLRALHSAGKLHRDLKPNNVMVAEGRVVLLDFGLVREFGDSAATVTQDEAVVGTPAYMAPEQVRNTALSEACDWYAVGVMLYEALSGALPFTGQLYELFRRKLHEEPTPIRELVPGLPEPLAKLCMALLQREPQLRPGYDEVATTLAAFVPTFEVTAQTDSMFEQLAPVRTTQSLVIGRELERAELERLFDEAACSELVVAHVRGVSGSGKTALIESFFQGLQAPSRLRTAGTADPLVLRARCYEREAMPYKALDGLLDALSDHLARLDDLTVAHTLPANIAELARAFPVLNKVPAVKGMLTSSPWREAARERVSAQDALRELLHRLGRRTPLIVWIDDLQWADLDSMSVLKSWIEASEPPPLLLVLSYRSDELDTNACLKLLLERGAPSHAREITIEVPPLTAAETRQLCGQALEIQTEEQQLLTERIVAESQGSPFLARQLLTLAQMQRDRGVADYRTLTIAGLASQLTELLSPEERAVLDVLAVAGRPVPPQLALRAANVQRGGSSQLHALNSVSLTRMRVVNAERHVEIYHQRMGEALSATLQQSERVAITQRLLDALLLSGESDPDWLHLLAVGAERNDIAVRYGCLAAERASASLAFERAAELYRDCIARSSSERDAWELWCKLGTALDACGHGIRAAEAYLEAAARAPEGEVIELKRIAATHCIRSGDFERGEALVREVLDALEIDVPRSEAGLIAAIAWERVRLAARGLEFSWREADRIDPVEYRRALMYCSLSIDTQAYDPVRAGLFAARALRSSLELGSPVPVSAAMCVMAATYSAVGSERDVARANRLLARAEALAVELKQPLLLTRVYVTRAMCAFLTGRAEDALGFTQEAERYFRLDKERELPGAYYLRTTLRATRVGAAFQLGRVRDSRKELREALEEARATDSRTTLLQLSLVAALHEIAQGDAQRTRERLEKERAQLPAQGFGALHLMHLIGVMRVACALGDYTWARPTVDQMWPRFQRSLVRHSVWATLAYGAHARFLLNQHVIEHRRGAASALLRDDMRALHKLSSRVGPAAYTRFRARLAFIEGGRARALPLFREHVEASEHERYFDDVERAKWALGRVLGGAEGAAMCARVVEALSDHGMVDPEREITTHFPELVEG